ncbi:N-acetylglucosamine kinase [Bacillus sp. JCM 19045]|nr:N-acetylglucosamine kinase [Bacillus sp. JCM 19045]
MFLNGKIVASELVKKSGLSIVTINSLMKELLDENVISEGSLIQQPMGRPAIEYFFQYDLQHMLLLSLQDFNGTLCLVAKTTNLSGTEKQAWFIELPEITLDWLIGAITRCLEDSDVAITQISLSIPGKVFDDTVTSSWKQQLDGWSIKAALQQKTAIPIDIQNDAHLTTIGFCIRGDYQRDGTIVGIFYPQESTPGVTIFSNKKLIEGHLGLAGEGKYLPFLMDKQAPKNDEELMRNIAEMIAVYNAVIAPNMFVISSNELARDEMNRAVSTNKHLPEHPNKPEILIDTKFQESMTHGLRWLAHEGTPYYL